MKQPTSTIKTYTPEEAGNIMDEHYKRLAEQPGLFKQRPMSKGLVMKYTQVMKNGNWHLSPEPIIYDTNNFLIEGQHRLEATRRSGIPQTFRVEEGWPPETINYINTGKSRSVACIMGINGYINVTNRASVAGTVFRICNSGSSTSHTFEDTEYLFKKLGFETSLEEVLRKSKNKNNYVGKWIGPLAYYHTVKPQKALQFADGFFNLESKKGSPVNLLLQWISSNGGSRSKGLGLRRCLQAICFCLKAWDENITFDRIICDSKYVAWLADQNPAVKKWVKTHISSSNK